MNAMTDGFGIPGFKTLNANGHLIHYAEHGAGWRYDTLLDKEPAHNTAPDMIANMEETADCKGHWIKASVQSNGQFNVVWKTPGPVKAKPWSPYIEGNDKKPDYPAGKSL